jgi:hypothetical protein
LPRTERCRLETIGNALLAIAAAVILGKGRARFLFLYAPDVSWTALISGGLTALWLALYVTAPERLGLDRRRRD